MVKRTAILIALVLAVACAEKGERPKDDRKEGGTAVQMQLTSKAFSEGGMIPRPYTCDGDDVAPQLAWENVPEGTKSFVLIMDDPDAPVGTWDHWIVYNIPDTVASLPDGASKDKMLRGGIEGVNSWGRTNWGGPCPPGGTHRYIFKLYALDTMLEPGDKPKKRDIEKAMEGHMLGQAQLMGRYKRSR
jgi:Raf kinase inhibitor-like YbhB/YbcL family protein